jgi:hypothetical protein
LQVRYINLRKSLASRTDDVKRQRDDPISDACEAAACTKKIGGSQLVGLKHNPAIERLRCATVAAASADVLTNDDSKRRERLSLGRQVAL